MFYLLTGRLVASKFWLIPRPSRLFGPYLGTSALIKMADAEGFEVVKKRRGHKNRKSDENYRLVKFNLKESSSFETTQFDLNQVKMNIDKYRHEKVQLN